MNRRRAALMCLLLFVAGTGASIAVGGSRPHLDQGTAPWLLQVLAYLAALTAGVLLLTPADGEGDPGDRRTAFLVVAALVALVLIDATTLATDSGGANIGAGFARMICLLVMGAAAVRLALSTARASRSRP